METVKNKFILIYFLSHRLDVYICFNFLSSQWFNYKYYLFINLITVLVCLIIFDAFLGFHDTQSFWAVHMWKVWMQNRCRVVWPLQWSVLGLSSSTLPVWQPHSQGVMLDWVRHSLKRCPGRADQAGPGQQRQTGSRLFSPPLLELWGLAAALSGLAVTVTGGS